MTLHCQELTSVGLHFGTPEAPCLTTVPVRSACFSVTRIQRSVTEGQIAEVDLPPADAYFLMLYLDDALHCDIRHDGSWSNVRRYERGSICLVDLHDGASIALHDNLHALAFMLPRSLFDEIANMSSSVKPHRLLCRRGALDSVIGNLGMALLPLFDEKNASPPALLQHLATAVCAHIMHDYGDDSRRNGSADSSLSVLQEKSAKEFMLANLGDDLTLPVIAAAIGLSANHFSQEFKKATGFSPHQWLTRMRMEKAKELLASQNARIGTVAEQCGFRDHSHFTKVFSKETGMTPAVWRNARLH